MVKPVYKMVISSVYPNLVLSIGFFYNISLIYSIKRMGDIGDLYGTLYDKGMGLVVTFSIHITVCRSVIKESTYYISFVFYPYYFSRKIRRLRKTVLKTPDTFIVSKDITLPHVKACFTLYII